MHRLKDFTACESEQECPAHTRDRSPYSYRRASIGFNRDAFRDG